MAPKFWMEFRRLTMTFFLDIARAPLARFTVTIIGSISGVSPTATARPKSRASTQLCFVRPMMRNTTATITTMKRIMSQVNPAIPLSKLVFERWPASLRVMAPKYVRAPVLTTTPRAVPESTLVPWKHALGSSSADLPLPGTAAALFSTGIDSPVRALWLTKKSLVDDQPQVGGHERTGVQQDHVSRDDLRQRDFRVLALPQHVHRRADHGLELLHRAPRSLLLEGGEPDADEHHAAHHDGGAQIPHDEGNPGDDQELDDERVGEPVVGAQERPALLGDHLVGPELPALLLGLFFRQALFTGGQVREAFLGRKRARREEGPFLVGGCDR